MKQALKFRRVAPSTLISMLMLLTSMYPLQAQSAPATSWTPVGETSTPRPDYGNPQYWMMAPQNPNALPVDVLFFHTTTFHDPNYVNPATGAMLTAQLDPTKAQVWNQTFAAAIQESTAAALTNTQASVFAAS